MAEETSKEWTPIYQTPSQSDADLVRTTLEVAGYAVSVTGGGSGSSRIPSIDGVPAITLSVPAEDADDARALLRDRTSLLNESAQVSGQEEGISEGDAGEAPQTESIEEAAAEILELRRQHQIAACTYCGIPTLDVSELDLDSHRIALLRAGGLGVNSATFSEFKAGERICTDCAGHLVTCDLCGRTLDGFIDEGEYRRAKADEAYVCVRCIDAVDTRLESDRDW